MRKILETDNKILQSMIDKALELEALNRLVLPLLAPELKPHCRVANYSHGILTLTVDSAAWGMKLKFSHSELLHRLRTEAQLYNLKSIKQLVRPFNADAVSLPQPQSQARSVDIGLGASTVTYPPLKEALQRLAKDLKNCSRK